MAAREGGHTSEVLQSHRFQSGSGIGDHAPPLCSALQPAAPPIGPGKQIVIADDEEPAQIQAGMAQETTPSPSEMGQDGGPGR